MKTDTDWEYYVHYEQFNRRLDTWVLVAEMDLATVFVPSAPAEGPDGKKNNQKRKHGEGEGHAVDEEHAEFDPRELQQHEEFTKVRNILKVELVRVPPARVR